MKQMLTSLCLLLESSLVVVEATRFRPAAQKNAAPLSNPKVFDAFQWQNDTVETLHSQLRLHSLELAGSFSWKAGFFKRQEETCEYPVICPDGASCCPEGYQCCTQIAGCCPDNSVCHTEPQGCCPNDAQTCGGTACADPGSVCCSGHVCPGGYACNDIGGQQLCCPEGWIACKGGCCPDGSTCAAEASKCSYTISATQQQTQTTISSVADTITEAASYVASVTLSSEEAITESETASASVTQTATSGLCPASSNTALDERARKPKYPYSCTPECIPATGESMPVWEVSSVPGQTDQLVYSMCKGINARVQAGTIQPGLADGEDILSWNGGGKENRNQVVDCDGYCDEARDIGYNFQCDEYPFASFNPPGGAQTALCIEAAQNSGKQGPMLGAFVTRCMKSPGDKMLVRITGGCSQFAQTPPPKMLLRRQQQQQQPRSSDTIELSASNATLSDPLGDGSLLYIYVPIGAVSNGAYDLGVSFDGIVENLTVLDNDGIVYAKTGNAADQTVNSVDVPTGVTQLSFTIDDAENGLAIALIAYASQALNVSYTGTATLAPNNTASGAGTSAGNSSSTKFSLAWSIGQLLVTASLLIAL